MTWLWIILVFAIVGFVIYRVRQVRAYDERVAEHEPFMEFVTNAANTITAMGPTTWRSTEDNSWESRDHDIEVLDELIKRGNSIDTPIMQKVYQNAYLSLLVSFRDEWSGYPYEGSQGQAEFIAAHENTKKCMSFYDIIRETTYPKAPSRMTWENYVFGPKARY
jgi:hypothetical protein